MESQPIHQHPPLDPHTTVLSITERHLQEWLDQVDYLRDSHAPTDELAFCQSQITRLQRDIHQLQSRHF